MKKMFAFALTVMLTVSINFTVAFAANDTCILIKFSNGTRYQSLDTASVLSELVLEKLLTNGFNINESKPLDEDLEQQLFYEKSAELMNAEKALANKNLNLIFEGPAFDNSQAQTIGTAEVGQIISPSITSKIGKAYNAEYLIQGNVINMGSGSWQSDYIRATRDFPVDETKTKAGISIQVDLRIIKASTGEVIWKETATGTKTNERIDAFIFSIGSSKLTSELYTKALEDVAEKISNSLITDFKANKLFVK